MVINTTLYMKPIGLMPPWTLLTSSHQLHFLGNLAPRPRHKCGPAGKSKKKQQKTVQLQFPSRLSWWRMMLLFRVWPVFSSSIWQRGPHFFPRWKEGKGPDGCNAETKLAVAAAAKINHCANTVRWRDGSWMEDRVVLLARGANWPG